MGMKVQVTARLVQSVKNAFRKQIRRTVALNSLIPNLLIISRGFVLFLDFVVDPL